MSATDYFPVLTDHLGTPRKVLDKNGATRWSWDAKEPFGNTLPQGTHGSLGAFKFNLRFPGQWFDQETGLYHNGMRDYHPGLGRYIQSDPLGLEAGWNTYGYAGANSLNYSDPYGLFFTELSYKDPRVSYVIRRLSIINPDAKKAIQNAAIDPRPVTIMINNVGNTSFVAKNGHAIIHWDPEMGLANACNPYSNGPLGSILPGLLLLHEIDHFNDSSVVDRYMTNINKRYRQGERWQEWTNEAERRTITGIEWTVAADAGWMKRISHNINYPHYP